MSERVGADHHGQNDALAPSIYRSAYTDKQRVELGIRKVSWPARSPDLNTIENVWAMLKKRTKKVQDAASAQSKRSSGGCTEEWKRYII